MRPCRVIVVHLAVLLCCAAAVHGQTEGVSASVAAPPGQDSKAAETPSIYDRIWRFREWYRNDSNPVIQRLRFSGRYQHDFATVSADQGDETEWNVRRMRLGFRANLFHTITVHAEADLNPQEADPVYVRLTDAYVEWSAREHVALTFGKQSMPFTLDGATSSKELLSVDRSNLANNIWFTEEYLPGVTVSGAPAPWVYIVGVYSAGAKNREFGDFSGGVTTLGSIGYDFATSMQAKEALLSVNYVYQNPDPDNTFTKPFQHVVSLNFKYETARWGFRSDLSATSGYGDQSNLLGITAMPFFNVTPKLQVAVRYTFLDSPDPNGLELAAYEDRVVGDRGDRFNELSLGVSYYFYDHQLKLQSSVQFADMRDLAADGGAYSGVSWTTGIRIGW
ncbi:MAG TPA: porin [Vicinamibacterales bacterium]|nr:porin [Vicinamibacterales bacterium]